MDETELEKLFMEAKMDKSVFSRDDIDELLSVIKKEKSHHLENLTAQKINKQLEVILLKERNLPEVYDKLVDEYRYIDELHEVLVGNYVRWLREDGYLTAGGFVTEVRIGKSDEPIVTCVSSIEKGKIVNYFFNKNMTFQKLSVNEKMILAVKDLIAAKK